MRPMFAPLVPSTSVTWVSQASIDNGMIRSYGLRKRIEAVKNCRNITKSDMKYNDLMPKMKVDPESYVSHSTNSKCPLQGAMLIRFTDCRSRWDSVHR